MHAVACCSQTCTTSGQLCHESHALCQRTWRGSRRMATACGRLEQHELQTCRIITSNAMPSCTQVEQSFCGQSQRANAPLHPGRATIPGSEVSMACPPALDELLGRSSQSCKVQHMTNGDSAAHLSAKVAAVWPQSLFIPHFRLPSSDGSLKGSADVPKGSSASPKGSATSVIGSSSSVKGTTPNGKPPVSPTSKSASARSDVASHHCCCSDNQSYIRSQHFPPSQYFAGITLSLLLPLPHFQLLTAFFFHCLTTWLLHSVHPLVFCL